MAISEATTTSYPEIYPGRGDDLEQDLTFNIIFKKEKRRRKDRASYSTPLEVFSI